MKRTLSFILFLMIVFISFGQVQENTLRGKIFDTDKKILPGASIVIVGTKYGINANEAGEYLFNNVPTGKLTVQASYVGYKTVTIDFVVQQGQNHLDFIFEPDEIKLDGITVTSQKREQQILDVPITMSVIDAQFMEDNDITELDELAELVPGMQVRMQGANRPSIVIRGLTSDEVSPAAQPRVSVFYNNVPISRVSGAAVELFDMQQVEVLKGPQGTLFGRSAQIGAIHYLSKKPTTDFHGYITAGLGNFNQRKLNGAINFPVVKNKLMLRAAAAYDYRDGYIQNTFGGKLNGKNTLAGRLSASYLPSENDRIDLTVNYQRDDNPGLGFMSMNYHNTESSTDPFGHVASLEQGNNLSVERDLFDVTLSARHYINETHYWTSTSSFRKIDDYSRWDGDGTAAAAIDMSEDNGAWQFFQEIRYNYSIKNKLNGSIGSSYWHENANQNFWFSTNEQNMFHLFFNTGFLVTPDGQPVPVTNLPNDPQLGPLAGLPLVTDHQEDNNSTAVNQAFEGFADANYQLTHKLSFTVGVRFIGEWFDLTNMAQMSGGSPATLGYLSGNYPNLLFKPSEEKKINESTVAFTYRGGLKYSFNESSNLYAGYSKGRRPIVLQFTSAGEEQTLEAEIVNSYDLGFKTALQQRLWFDLGIFYHDYFNFQTSAWVADPGTGEFNYIVKDGGKASAYGAETNIKYVVLQGLNIFGNYAYIHARFAEKDVDEAEQNYANNMFRLTPDHSFAMGLNARIEIASDIFLFGIPTYSYKSKIFFEDANTTGLEQDGYGLLNFRAGIELADKRITLAVFGNNLLDEKYIVSAGNTGSLFGAPTRIPGVPRMFGTKLTWEF